MIIFMKYSLFLINELNRGISSVFFCLYLLFKVDIRGVVKMVGILLDIEI